MHLLPGGAPTKKSTAQYPALLATVRPRDPIGQTQRRLVADLVKDIIRLDAQLKDLKVELKDAVLARGSRLMDIHGVGPAGAARILVDVGDVARFLDRNHFASWTGTAPIDASSGAHTHHWLSRAGNRRLNHVLYIAGIVQLRNDTEGRAYYRRKREQGKTSMEAMRCLRRRLSDVVYRQLLADAAARTDGLLEAGPGGHSGTTSKSSVTGLTPDTGPSEKPLPGPAPPRYPARRRPGRARPGRHQAHRGDAPEVSTWSAPPDERR